MQSDSVKTLKTTFKDVESDYGCFFLTNKVNKILKEHNISRQTNFSDCLVGNDCGKFLDEWHPIRNDSNETIINNVNTRLAPVPSATIEDQNSNFRQFLGLLTK